MKFKDIDIKELFELMAQNDVSEVSLHDGKVTIEVKRGDSPVVVNAGPGYAGAYDFQPQKSGGNRNGTDEAQDEEPLKEPEPENNNYHPVEAPLVGTFYRAPSPESDPFVEVGDSVKKGEVLCIVEAMKSMNEIQSDVSGVVREICVENAEMVEFEQVLFRIETL